MAQPRPDRARIEILTAALDAAYGPAADEVRAEFVRAPGRVNLIGDHMEYNEGFMLPVAIEPDTWIAFRRRQDGLVRVVSRHSRDEGTFRIDALDAPRGRAGRERSWTDYVAGAAWSLREAAIPIRGFDGVVHTTIPMGLGLSGSAALATASALASLCEGRILAPPSLAALAQRAERDYVGVDCGIMDQMASAAGREGKALLLDCRSLETRHVALPYGIHVVVCDTGERSHMDIAAYDTRRAECSRAVALLAERMPGLCSLRDLTAASLRRHRAVLPENVAARADHVVAENARVLGVAVALERGDLGELGRLFAESHASLRHLYRVSSPALDTMVEIAESIPGVIAARMTGSGRGGCTVNLVLEDAIPALRAAVGREYNSRTGLHGHVHPLAVVDGAGAIAVG